MNSFVQKSILVFLLAILVTACNSNSESNPAYPGFNASAPMGTRYRHSQDSQPYPSVDKITPPQDAPQSDTGKASISGTLYSFVTSKVIAQTLLYLTKAYGTDNRSVPPVLIGPEPSRGDITEVSDEKGHFFVKNIPPGNYFLIVAAPFSWSLAVTSSDRTPLLIELKPDQKQSLGIVYVP